MRTFDFCIGIKAAYSSFAFIMICCMGCDDSHNDTTDINDSDTSPALSPKEAEKHCPGEFSDDEGEYACLLKDVITKKDASTEDALVWIPEITYRLKNLVFIGDDTDLIIQPGTTILGETDTLKSSPAALVITPNATIDAKGTIDDPILFTSANAPGERAAGDWGGLVLLGDAPLTSQSTRAVAEGDIDGNGATGGGDNTAHFAGALSYVRIEFAGRPIYALVGDEMKPATPLHGLTMIGVGNKTEIDHLQVHRSGASGISIAGGAVNLRYVLVSGAVDHGFNWFKGWVGRAQFVIVHGLADLPSKNLLLGVNGDQTIEYDDLPRSNPILYNFTLSGGDSKTPSAVRLESGTAGTLANILVTDGDLTTCIDLESDESWEQTLTYDLTISGSIVPDTRGCFAENDTTGYHEKYWFKDVSSNRVMDISCEASDDPARPSFSLDPASSAMDGSVAPPKGVSFFDDVKFIGAVGKVDWTAGWTDYPEN